VTLPDAGSNSPPSVAVALIVPPTATEGEAFVAIDGDAFVTVTLARGSSQALVAASLRASPA
jgi:hypothetical protein